MPVKLRATPFGMYTNPRRRSGRAAVWASATPAGTIASSSGNASAAPIPRNTVRRSRAFFVMNMLGVTSAGFPHPERRTLHDPRDQRRDTIVVLRRIAHDGTNCRHVRVVEAA